MRRRSEPTTWRRPKGKLLLWCGSTPDQTAVEPGRAFQCLVRSAGAYLDSFASNDRGSLSLQSGEFAFLELDSQDLVNKRKRSELYRTRLGKRCAKMIPSFENRLLELFKTLKSNLWFSYFCILYQFKFQLYKVRFRLGANRVYRF